MFERLLIIGFVLAIGLFVVGFAILAHKVVGPNG